MNVVEMDAASNNGVDNIREIVDAVQYSPAEGNYKVYIIDEVHMLSTGAFNALLKTLEEPPSYVIFILATTEVHKIPITILSRCQRYDFHRMTIDTIQTQLRSLVDKEGVESEDKALRYIAKVADGSMRDGLSLLDQCIAFYLGETLTYDKVLDVLGAVDNEVFYRLLQAVLSNQVKQAIEVIDEMIVKGRELGWFVNEFIWYLRNLLLAQSSEHCEDMIEMSTDNLALLKEQVEQVSLDALMRYIRIMSELSNSIRYANQKRILVEIAIVKLCQPQMEIDTISLKERINRLEVQLEELERNPVQVNRVATQELGVEHIEQPTQQKVVFPEALSEDVRKLAREWTDVISNLEESVQGTLRKATLSVEGDEGDTLVILCSNPAIRMLLDGRLQELQLCVNEYLNKEVKIRIHTASMEDEQRGTYPDIGKLIKSGVTVEYE